MVALRYWWLLLLGLPQTGLAAREVAQELAQEFTYLVVARDYTRHRVTLRYVGQTLGDVWQSGSAAHGLDLRDTRDCHWDFRNTYRTEHVRTVDAASGAPQPIVEPLSLQQAADHPLHAPAVTQVGALAAEMNALIGIQRLERIFSRDDLKGALPRVALNLASDLVQAVPTVMVRVLARVTGLRSGVNCGEARGAVDASRQAWRDALTVNMSVAPKVEYYLNAGNLLRNWRYLDAGGRAVGALIVYPGREWPDHLIAATQLWRESRDQFLGGPVPGAGAPAPTEAEVREFAELLVREPDSWIETLNRRHALRFDQARFDALKARVLGPAPAPLFPGTPVAGVPGSGPGDYVVGWRDYPEPLSPEWLMLDYKTADLVARCGSGRLYTLSFLDGGMKPEQKAMALATLERQHGNAAFGAMADFSRFNWIAARLPREHPLQEQITALAAGLQPRFEAMQVLGRVFDPRNRQYQACLGLP